jgi:hypothetical protein
MTNCPAASIRYDYVDASGGLQCARSLRHRRGAMLAPRLQGERHSDFVAAMWELQ